MVAGILKADSLNQFHCPLVKAVQCSHRQPELGRKSTGPLQGNADIVEDRQVRKHRGYLERAHKSHSGHLGRIRPCDVMIEQRDRSACRLQKFGQQIEDRGLAGTIRADQCMHPGMVHVEIDIIDGNETAKVTAQAAG